MMTLIYSKTKILLFIFLLILPKIIEAEEKQEKEQIRWYIFVMSGGRIEKDNIELTMTVGELFSGKFLKDGYALSSGFIGGLEGLPGIVVAATLTLKAEPISSAMVRLTWQLTGTTATKYVIQRKKIIGEEWGTITILSGDETTYEDTKNLIAGKTYRYKIIAYKGIRELATAEAEAKLPEPAERFIPYGNLFYPKKGQEVVIQYKIEKEDEGKNISIRIYNLAGELIKDFKVEQKAGWHTVTWDGKNDDGILCATGIYIIQFITKTGGILTEKIALIR